MAVSKSAPQLTVVSGEQQVFSEKKWYSDALSSGHGCLSSLGCSLKTYDDLGLIRIQPSFIRIGVWLCWFMSKTST